MNNLQVIKSIAGEAEYILLPIAAYQTLKPQIDKLIISDYEPFLVEDYVTNPVALARIRSNLTQQNLAKLMDVSQAYISKIESQDTVTAKVLAKIKQAIFNAM